MQDTTQTYQSGQDTDAALVLYDVTDRRQELSQLKGSREVDALTSQICVNDLKTIVCFGGGAAAEIAKCSDAILKSINMSQVTDSGQLLGTLARIMERFDMQEITADEKKGLLGKLLGGAQKQLDQILDKYRSMGDEVDKVYVELRRYEAEIGESNQKLQTIFDANVNYYQQLVKYILAGEQGLEELDAYLAQMRRDLDQHPGNALAEMEYSGMQQARTLLDQRVQDLRIAEIVAMQAIPMLQTMQFGNMNLIRKINSAFIITLPVFKQALTQAVLLKRQRIQAQALEALDRRTNEMLQRNAHAAADQARLTAQMASSGSVQVETLEQSWRTIVGGIEETRRMQAEAAARRSADSAKLTALKQEIQTHKQA